MSALSLDRLETYDPRYARTIVSRVSRREIAGKWKYILKIVGHPGLVSAWFSYDFDKESWLYWRGLEGVPAVYHRHVFAVVNGDPPFS